MRTIDLNCDIGESYYEKLVGNDSEIIPLLSSCNIACGFHGGDPLTIQNAIKMALKSNVGIGAHPSFPDLANFGRTYMPMSGEALDACMKYQIGVLSAMVQQQGGKLQHVKPHGALYNAAALDYELALRIATSIYEIDDSLYLLGMAHSEMERAAEQVGLSFVPEAFADRNYTDEGNLVPRSQPNAVVKDTGQVLERTLKMILDKEIVTLAGNTLAIDAASICVHGDTPNAVALLKAIRFGCKETNVTIESFRND